MCTGNNVLTIQSIARETSDTIPMDNNFALIIKTILWGNITAVIITFVSAVASSGGASVLSEVQLLWINIIVDAFAALALATNPASIFLLDRKPGTRGTRLFTAGMVKMILR